MRGGLKLEIAGIEVGSCTPGPASWGGGFNRSRAFRRARVEFSRGVVKSMQQLPNIGSKSRKIVLNPHKNGPKWFENRGKSVKISFGGSFGAGSLPGRPGVGSKMVPLEITYGTRRHF